MKCRRLAALGLTAALTLSWMTVPALAATFTDIETHWAKSYVEKMADKGIVKGYENNTYRPDKTLSVAEGLAFCARALQVDDKTAAAVLEKHEAYLDELLGDEQSWFRTEFALCLEAGIITKPEFKTMVLGGQFNQEKTMTKEDLAVYMVRAMQLDLLAASQTTYPLGFMDADDISEDAKPSIYLLNMYGIITGDEKNNFGPALAVNRAIMATILSRVLDFKEERGIVTELPDFTDYKWLSGTVAAVTTSDLGVTVITLDDGFQQEMQAVAVPASVNIYLNNMKAELKDLKTGIYVRAALDDKGNVTDLHILGELTTVSGNVSSYTDTSVLLTMSGIPKTLTMNRFTLVEAGGQVGDTTTLDLEAGYGSAQAVVDGRGTVVAIQFKGGTTKYSGLFAGREAITGSTDLALKVTGYDGVTQRYTMPETVTINVNGVPGKNAAMTGYSGKFVTIRVSNDTGLVSSVSFDTATTYLQGSVRAVTWQSSNMTMSITDLSTSKSTSYSVAKDVVCTYGGEAVEFKNLQKDWFVTARMVSGEIVELVCYPGTTASTGTLLAVDYSKVPEVTLTVENEDGMSLDFLLDIEDLPTIRRDGKSSSIDKLKTGDTVVVTVKYNEVTLIEATPRTANLAGTIAEKKQTLAGDVLVVDLTDGTQATYTVTAGTSITQDGKAVSFDSLKVGYQISMVADGEKVSSIEVNNSTVVANQMTGTVVYVNTSEKTILFKETGSDAPITVSTSSAKIMSTNGSSLSLSSLKAGDNLVVYGSYSGLVFQATMILR